MSLFGICQEKRNIVSYLVKVKVYINEYWSLAAAIIGRKLTRKKIPLDLPKRKKFFCEEKRQP